MKAKINRTVLDLYIAIKEKHVTNIIKYMSITYFEEHVTG
jgi:hypothetical protein